MTPASVTIDELEQISIDQLERVKALREQKYGTPGDVATKHPNESYGEFYTRKGRGLTYDEATAGAWLQIALAAVTIESVPVIAAYFFTTPVMALITGDSTADDKAVTRLGQQYNTWASMSLLPTVWYMAIRQFMQAMQIVNPATIVSLLAVGANAGAGAKGGAEACAEDELAEAEDELLCPGTK